MAIQIMVYMLMGEATHWNSWLCGQIIGVAHATWNPLNWRMAFGWALITKTFHQENYDLVNQTSSETRKGSKMWFMITFYQFIRNLSLSTFPCWKRRVLKLSNFDYNSRLKQTLVNYERIPHSVSVLEMIRANYIEGLSRMLTDFIPAYEIQIQLQLHCRCDNSGITVCFVN